MDDNNSEDSIAIDDDINQNGDNPDEDNEEIHLDLDATEVELNHSRVKSMDILSTLTKTEFLGLRNNFIKKIEGLNQLVTLRELELYDNQITRIENLDSLVNLEILDLSFNRIRKIENLENLVNLKKLFLINNKISQIENLSNLTALELLELGSNRIRVIQNVDKLINLKSLFLGKNKITKLENLSSLKSLELLSIQSNRIIKIEGLDQNNNLEQLYISNNGITDIESLDNNTKLTTLDVAANRIKKMVNIGHLELLEEFWCNNNGIDDWKDLEVLSNLKNLKTVYFEHNPISSHQMYRKKIMLLCPQLTQIDATLCLHKTKASATASKIMRFGCNMDSNVDQVLNALQKVEEVAEDILRSKQEIIDLNVKLNNNREALNVLKRHEDFKHESNKLWLCFGNSFIKTSVKSAKSLITEDHNQLNKQINDLRDDLKPKVDQLRQLEGKEELKGFNLKPLDKNESFGSKLDIQLIGDMSDNTNEESSPQMVSKLYQLINQLNANTFSDSVAEDDFDRHFLSSDFKVFVLLVNSFADIKEDCYKRNKLLSLTTRYVYCDQTLKSLLLKTCRMWSVDELNIIGPKLETILVTLPDIVANNMKTDKSHKFERNFYFKTIVKTIYLCIEDVYQNISQSVDSSLEFLSSLLGRISLLGYIDIVFKEVLIKMIDNCDNDFIWRRLANRVIIGQKPQYIEVLLKSVFIFVSNHLSIGWVIGKSVDTNIKIKFLLTNKFLLIHEFKNDQILVNIFGYLCQTSDKLFFVAFNNVLNSWSNSSAIKYRSYSQHLYLSRALMIGSRFMKTIDFSDFEDTFRRLTMNGIEAHLRNSQTDFRNIGLTVGQTLMSVLYRGNNEINFEIQENDEIRHLNDLFLNNCNVKDREKLEQKILPKNDVKESQENNYVSYDKHYANNGNNGNKNNDLDSDDDEDDDLIPYDISEDKLLADKNKPIYLRDCMDGLLDSEKTEWFIKCLQNAEQIIRTNSDLVEEVSLDFIQILFRLDDNYAINDFVGLRLRAMISLCVCSPKSVSTYLCQQFYGPNYTIRQRLDTLEVLLSSSTELSTNIKQNMNNKSDLKEISLPNYDVSVADIHWTHIVKKRVEAKTRIIAHKSKNSEEFVNRFIPFAGHFFFPLMKNIYGNEVKFHFLEDEDYVLGRLVYTLGLILKNVSFAPISTQMAKELLEFIIVFRYHSEVFVREAVIFAFCMVLMNVLPVCLINNMSLQIVELQLWLKDITEREPNSQCVQKAVIALQLLKEVVEEMPINSLFNK
ncbi:telomere length regulation protein TEL2 homolog [Oppia nitens]|uniref:telomere length regulation protein TEL2 homolog n=1 Tax=Oppia nitens TaxID=1686743 RepID=UPI0023DAF7C1|nr:telomere length regulation protein TEL2 homolog [Oppia nitens]